MPFFQLYAAAFAFILTYVLLIWLSSLALRNAGIIDIFWGLGFVLLAALGFVLANGYTGRKILIAALVAIWGLRLSLHILRRNWGKPEDYRYRAWRKIAGGKFWLVSLFKVFLLQGLLLWLIAAPILAAESSPLPDQLTLLDWAGLVVWIVGFFFEAVGDWQLDRFRRRRMNRSELLRTGLWAFTRHPNYFGDATVWWGLFLIGLGTPGGFLTLYSPVLMMILLLRVTGVAVLEKGLAKTKPGYKEYVDSTCAFFPWFPRKRAPWAK